MKLIYRCFGAVALLIRYSRVKIVGDTVGVECDLPDGARLVLYSERTKQSHEYRFKDGMTSVPVKVFESGVSVLFDGGEATVPIHGTPIEVAEIGDERYLMGGLFSTTEELRRVHDALIYMDDLVREACAVAGEVKALREEVQALRTRADSGDIINF